jgi:hypothetical protein
MITRHWKPLLAVAENYILESCPSLAGDVLASLKQIVEHYIDDVITFERASALFLENVHTTRPIDRISQILSVPQTPICPQFGQYAATPRRRTHPWSEYEDQRLLCAIHRFGLDHWPSVSQFVGNFRTRAQCSQRWYRGLDPRISKVLWTDAEEQKLLALVQRHGDRAWTRISAELGNRSDAQCRYRYRQLVKDTHEFPPQIPKSHSEPAKVLQAELKAVISASASLSQKRFVLPSIDEITRKSNWPPIKDRP